METGAAMRSAEERWGLAKPAAANTPELGETDLFGFTGETREYTEKLLNLFRIHLSGNRNLNANSLVCAMGALRRFMIFTARPIWAWEHKDVSAFIDFKKRTVEDFSVSSQAFYFTYLRILQSWLFNDLGLRQEIFQKFGVQVQEWIDGRNAIPLRGKRRKAKKVTHALDEIEFQQLMDEFDAAIELAFASNSKAAYPLARDKVITAVSYEYGLRVSEVVKIKLGDFHQDRRHPIFKKYALLQVVGKGSITGAPHALDPQIVAVLEWYEEFIRPHFQSKDTKEGDLYFYSERGGRLTDEQIRRRLLQMGVQAGIKKRVTPHVLRRSHGTDAMALLGPIGVQHQLRHAEIGTTFESYYRPDPETEGRGIANAVSAVIKRRAEDQPKEPE